MRNPEFRKCSDNDRNHEWLDYCWTCAPWWDQYPICPDCKVKLNKGKRVDACPKCRKRYAKTADYPGPLLKSQE